jgi:N-acetylglucosamine-6-phosphate deacetylase
MPSILLKNCAVVLPAGVRAEASILVDDGLIAGIYSDGAAVEGHEVVDIGGSAIFPGFIDVHIHGAVGVDVNEADADGLLEIAAFLAKNGVTAWVPTLVPDSDDIYLRVIRAIDRMMAMQDGLAVAQAVGVHYEGVFANEKMCGALRPEYFKKFTGDDPVRRTTTPSAEAAATPPLKGGELLELSRLKNGVHMTTFAPEIEGGVDLARELTRQGWVASIGHTKADPHLLDQAFAAGAKHITHFYNAMTGLHHRDVGVAGWALTNKDVTFDIIADGIHSDPRMLEFAICTKTPDKVSLISDSVAPTGLGDGEFELWGETITVENGRTRNERGSIAGSVITMLDAVKRMLSLGFSPVDVAKMASSNPAKLLGIDKTHGSLEVGKRADLVALDKDGNVELVMIGGEIVVAAKS